MRSAKSNYKNLKLIDLKKKYKSMSNEKRKKYNKSAQSAAVISRRLLGHTNNRPIFRRKQRKVISTAPKKTQYTFVNTRGGSLPNRHALGGRYLRPMQDMRHKNAKRVKAQGYNTQNNLVLLGGKFDPYGVAFRNSISTYSSASASR